MGDLREYARKKFSEIYEQGVDQPMVLNSERGVFNYSVQECKQRGIACDWANPHFRSTYKHKLSSLLLNLKNPANPDFLRHVLEREIETKHLAFLTPEEIDPSKWKRIHADVAKRFPTNDNVEIPESPLLQCGKCKSRRCTFYLLQTRSADEPMTVFVTCHGDGCGRRWKM
jgi:DNA-directed RNA polymerase subunit M/transcription elongation factor TFIIS